MIEVLINQGLAGNLKAVDKLLQLADKYAASEPQSYWDPVEAQKAREKLMRIIEVKAEERAKELMAEKETQHNPSSQANAKIE